MDPSFYPNGEADVSEVENQSDNVEINSDIKQLQQAEKNTDAAGNATLGINTNLSERSIVCDDNHMMVDVSQGRGGDKKINVCFYCHKKQQKFPVT